MERIEFSKEYFNIADTLECGQVFRFSKFLSGYMVYSGTKACYCYEDGNKTVIECESGDREYFYHYFDLERDYSKIVESAKQDKVIKEAVEKAQGIRILNQDKTESLFSFMVSQNNNIPRIKLIIERLCEGLGEKKEFYGKEYYAFPKVKEMAKTGIEFYTSIGLGYRAEYIRRLAENINNGFDITALNQLTTKELKSELIKIYGVGRKVADCVSLFGYHRSDSFPVDTWIEKVYKENYQGKLSDREKIADYFVERYKENAGYFQQYMFYYKRSLEKKGQEV